MKLLDLEHPTGLFLALFVLPLLLVAIAIVSSLALSGVLFVLNGEG